MKEIEMVVGPRIPQDLLKQERRRFLLPTLLLGGAALLLLISVFLPYWSLTLHAPQYPGGLEVKLYVNHVTGDVDEIDGLNHYIGMRSLKEAAPLERTLSIVMIVGIALLSAAAIYIHSPVAAFFSFPAFLFPGIFLADLYFWLWNFGTNLDPRAPLSSSVKPFVPPLLGEGNVGQFKTVAAWDIGLIMAFVASALIVVGLYFHRKAYKPLMEARFKAEQDKKTAEKKEDRR